MVLGAYVLSQSELPRLILLRRTPWRLSLAGALVLVVAVALAIATTTGGRGNSSSPASGRYVRPQIPSGVATKQNPTALERRVLKILGPGSRITSVVWLPDHRA